MNYNQPKSKFNEGNINVVDESFSLDFADTYQKQMFFEDNNLNETILEHKLKNDKKDNQKYNNLYLMNQYENFNGYDDDLNITIQDRKQEDFLEVRKFPFCTENEFLEVKKSVGNDLLNIQNYLLIRLPDYNRFDANKKIGPMLPLSYAIENHYKFQKQSKMKMQEKYDRLKNYIFNFRPNYVDGNGFYRGVMFRYIELLILYKKIDFLKSLIIDIHRSFRSNEIRNRLNIGNEHINPNLIIQVMITILELVENNRIIDAHLAFYKSILYSKIFDYSLILYLRYISYTYIKQNERKLYLESFPVLIGNLLPLNYEKNGMFYFQQFYENNLLKMFSCPEKIVIYLIPFILGINLNIILFEDKENEIVKKFDFYGTNILNINSSIFLLYRNGLFENIFNYEDNQKFNFIYNFYRNDIKPTFIKFDNPINIGSKNLVYNQNIENNSKSIYDNQNNQNKISNINSYHSQIIKNNNNLPNYNSNVYQNNQMIFNRNSNSNKNNDNNRIFSQENINDKSYEAFTYYNEKYSYKGEQGENKLGKSLNNQCKQNNNIYNSNIIQKNMNNNQFNWFSNIQTLNCKRCFSTNLGLKNIKGICSNCFKIEIVNQLKYFYVNYLQNVCVLEKANTISKSDFENVFMKKISINFDNKTFNIYQAIDEFNCSNSKNKFDFNSLLKDIILNLKQQICVYCYYPVQNSEFKFPCGCSFCCYQHLNLFMNEKIQNRMTYDFKCFCSFKYKPNKVFELCNFLYSKNIYKSFDIYIQCLNAIFCNICFKCGCEKINLLFVNIEGFCPNKFNHFICEECIKKNNSNISECCICRIQHQFMINNF